MWNRFVCLGVGALWLALGLAGCGGQRMELAKASVELPDQELYDRGLAQMEKKKCLDARALFRQLELRNPKGDLAPLVKIAIADTYECEDSIESNAEAVATYRSFLSFYPKHPRACYAQYRIAMRNFVQMEKPDRDQSETRKAVEEFQKLLVSYPDCEYASEARTKLDLCFNRLGDHDMKVGDYYFKLHKDRAAAGRYRFVVESYPAYPQRDRALYRLFSIYRRTKDDQKMVEARAQLLAEYPQSPYAGEVQKSVE